MFDVHVCTSLFLNALKAFQISLKKSIDTTSYKHKVENSSSTNSVFMLDLFFSEVTRVRSNMAAA